MSVIKNIIVSSVTVAAVSAAGIIGASIAQTVWTVGLEDKFVKKTQEWFS